MERITAADEKQAVLSNLNYLYSSNFQNVDRFIRHLRDQELLSPDDITVLLTHTSNSRRLQSAFKIIQEKDGFFDKLLESLEATDNKASVELLKNSIQDFVVNDNHLCRIRDIILKDITVIRDWAYIKNEFLSQPVDSHIIDTMIEKNKHPGEYILKTLRIWKSMCGDRATINTCIWSFRKKNYGFIADKLNRSKSEIIESSSIMASQTCNMNSKSKKPKCTTVAIWQESILIQQMNERFKEHIREIHFLKSRIELLEAQVAENSKNAVEVNELKRKVGEHEREMSVIQEIITSMQSQYKDSVYKQDGSGVWKRLGLDRFTGIPPTKALLTREIILIELKVKVSTLLGSLGQCKRLKKLTLRNCVLRGGEGENTEFRQCLLDLLNNCSPHLEVKVLGYGFNYYSFKVIQIYGTTSVKPFRLFWIRAPPFHKASFEYYFTDNNLGEVFDQNPPHLDHPSKYMPRECQALVLQGELPKHVIDDFTIHFKVTRLVLLSKNFHVQVIEILEQIRVRKNEIEYILLQFAPEIGIATMYNKGSKPGILYFPVAWTQVLQEAGFNDLSVRWDRIVFEKQLDSTWKARSAEREVKEIDRIMIAASKVESNYYVGSW